MPSHRYYPVLVALFATSLVVSNIIAVKLVDVLGMVLPAAVFLFPVTYILGDVLTEVYGYRRARQAIWIGFACNALAVAAISLGGFLTPAAFWNAGVYPGPDEAGAAYQAILGFAPRLLAASFLAYLAGEFLNAAVLARLKAATRGRHLWLRTISSTLVGQGVDSVIFLSGAFAGILSLPALGSTILSQWMFKSGYEALATPLTYLAVNGLKRAEGIDVFDWGVAENPGAPPPR
ncbi:MAG: queuosine precursor transporter [Anaerolineales bacterium]